MPLGGKQNGTVLREHGIRISGLVLGFFTVHRKKTGEMVTPYSGGHGIRGDTVFGGTRFSGDTVFGGHRYSA